jgi:ribosomal protein S18 acetylase RimI-like enzyme
MTTSVFILRCGQVAELQARNNKLNKLTLLMFEQNTIVQRLYGRLGYREVACESIYPRPLILCTGDAILLLKDLGQITNTGCEW